MKKDFNKISDVLKATEAALGKALTAAAVLVEGEAVLRCPVDTGNLRGSITHEVKADEARVGTNVEYAPYMEYGTSKQRSQPYLRPALDENRQRIEKLMGEIISESIKGATR